MNRRWTFILALCVSLICSVFARTASAGGDDSSGRIIGDPSDPGFPTGIGDPDIPEPAPSKYAKRVQQGGSMGIGWGSVGDRRPTSSVLMLRLRIVLKSLGIAYLHF
jgi:hypothetical protein